MLIVRNVLSDMATIPRNNHRRNGLKNIYSKVYIPRQRYLLWCVVMELKGRIVKFWYRLPAARENGTLVRVYLTYGKVDDDCRVKDQQPRMTAKGSRIKNPTVEGVRVFRNSFDKNGTNWKGEEVKVLMTDIVAVVYYGKEIPVKEFLERKQEA